MKLSISSYSFQAEIRAGRMTQEQVVEKAHELDFGAIEFTELTPCPAPTLEQQLESAARIRAKADELNMIITNYAIGANLYHECASEEAAELERVKGQLRVAAALGAPMMRHDICYQPGKECRSFDLMLPRIAKNVRISTEYAQDLGIRTCSENHGYIAQDSDRMERLFNAVNHPNYALLVDMGNFLCVDENPVTAVSRLAPYACYVHVKDMLITSGCSHNPGSNMTRGGNWFRGTVIGQGVVPVRQCLRILRKAGFDGYYAIEFEGSEECIPAITKGKENLERYYREVDADFPV